MVNDADNFTVEFPSHIKSGQHRALLMSCVLMMDYMMFENNPNQQNHHHHWFHIDY